MEILKVDKKKCINCGACVEVCPATILELTDYGPRTLNSDGCIACGHCVGVCPTEALDHELTPLNKQFNLDDINKLTPEEAEGFLRSRRSIRAYKATTPSKDLLEELVRIGHYAPTGHNMQGVSYILINDR